jgi:hypothetical protein
VLFGFATSSTDTWEWDGMAGAWALRAATGPSIYYWTPVMSYDTQRQRCVLLIWAGAPTYAPQTWEWDGSIWTQVATATLPPTAEHWVMAYDAACQRTVLFPNQFDQTGTALTVWEYDGQDWTALPNQYPPDFPAAHTLAAAFDPGRGVLVMIGQTPSASLQSISVASTWERAGAQWTRRESGSLDPFALYHGLCYDSARHLLVYVEDVPYPIPNSHEWEWSEALARWVVRTSTPTILRDRTPVFDAAGGHLLLFSGATLNGGATDATTRLYDGSVSAGPTITECGERYVQRSPRQSITLTIAASGSGTISYRWRHMGVPIPEGGPFSGTGSAQLTINPISMSEIGAYDALVQDSCGTTIRPMTWLVVQCYANCDGSLFPPALNPNDFECFLDLFAGGCGFAEPPDQCYVNCDHSTTPPILNINDFQCFLNAYAAGCP